jgi:hypothetical protein
MPQKVVFKRSKKTTGQSYDVTFSHLTAGEILCMKHALELYLQAGSTISSDLLAYLNNGVEASDDEWIKKVMK